MIIRDLNGELIKISKYECANDLIYYEKIMKIKKEFTKVSIHGSIKNVHKTTDFFSPKTVNKKQSSSLQSICDFINIEI